ncbi:DUF2061 domain-containing protein [archaeon]|nr:DUF2061 domain-containing protein [archaeon]
MQDSKRKSLYKTFSWRITATLTTMLIAWAIIGDIQPALAIGGVEFFAKMFIFYWHERAWSKMK